MVFSSLVFLFGFLPLTLLIYYTVPLKLRNLALFVLSLVFYGWGEPVYILLMLFSVVSAYAFGFFIEKHRDSCRKKAKLFLVLSLCINLSALVFFKYYNFIASNLAKISFFSFVPEIEGLSLPVGISFYTFQIMSYSIDLYRGQVPLAKRFVPFGTYVTLFPQLIAGPIVRYRDVCDQLLQRKETVQKFASGASRFCIGLSKKLVLGDSAAAVAEYFRSSAQFEPTALGSWMIMIFYTFHIYFDFSGYSDMAIGLGKMFGFEFPENFDYPYISKSITEFWRRWHITLSTWFREYIYIPLGGNRKHLWFNLCVVWLTTGLWHGADWNYLLWGAYFCVVLILEKAFLLKLLKKLPAFLTHFYSLLLIGLGWLLFFFNDLSELSLTVGSLAGAGAKAYNGTALYDALRLLPFFAVCVLACTPVPKKAFSALTKRFPKARVLQPILVFCGLLMSVAYMVGGSFSPFLYYIF